jgi:Ca-activated chloride channel family protein
VTSSSLNFEYPYLFLAFFLPYILQKILSKKDLSKNIPVIYFPYLKKIQLLQKVNQKTSLHNSALFSEIIFYLIWTLLTISLMNPRIIDKVTKINTEGYDIILAVDISNSMAALDFSIKNQISSRLDVAKKTVEEFILKRKGDRIGLVVFGKNAYLHVPLTFDINTATKMLQTVEVGMAGDSTSIGDAIGLSLKSLKDKKSGSTAIILLTDGDDTSSSIPPITAAKLVKEYHIPIYTIAMGREDKVPFPTANGRVVMVEMRVNKKLLQEISNITKGKFFIADDMDSLQKIYHEISDLKKTKAEIKNQITIRHLHQYIIFSVILLLSLVLTRKKWAT